MSESAPRGFARFSPDVINLVAWVLLLWGIVGVLIEFAHLANVAMSWRPSGLGWWPALELALGVVAQGLDVAAGLGLRRRRPWSLAVLMIALSLGLVIALGHIGFWVAHWQGLALRGLYRTDLWPRFVGSVVGSILLGVQMLVVPGLVIPWLWRFRREFRPLSPLSLCPSLRAEV